jgi:hypothetical protein
MPAWRRCVWLGLGWLAAACAASSAGTVGPPGEITGVLIVVSGDVSPILIDKGGRRAGWNNGRPLREIASCAYSFGSKEEETEEESPPSPGVDSAGDSTQAPEVQEFQMFGSPEGPGILAEGGCELLIDPHTSCRAHVDVVAYRGSRETHASLEGFLRTGTRYRWRVRWEVAADSCIVSMFKLKSVALKRRSSR